MVFHAALRNEAFTFSYFDPCPVNRTKLTYYNTDWSNIYLWTFYSDIDGVRTLAVLVSCERPKFLCHTSVTKICSFRLSVYQTNIPLDLETFLKISNIFLHIKKVDDIKYSTSYKGNKHPVDEEDPRDFEFSEIPVKHRKQ